MALSTARMHKVRGRPPLLAAGISSLSHSHSSSVRSLGYVFSFIFSFYTTHEDFSDRLLDVVSRKPFLRLALARFEQRGSRPNLFDPFVPRRHIVSRRYQRVRGGTSATS